MKIISINRKATHDYEIVDKFDAGIVLTGDEIKSIRRGSVSLADAFAVIKDGEVRLLNCYIPPYSHAYSKTDKSRRTRKLLLHRREISKLFGAVSKKGLTIIPLKMYLSNRGYAKVEIALAKHKKTISKKKELKEKDLAREASRELKERF